MGTDGKGGRLLVTGAAGQLGSAVVDCLTLWNREFIACSRNPEDVVGRAGAYGECRRVDFDRPDQLENAFSGSSRMLLISVTGGQASDKGGESIRLRRHLNALDAARRAGIRHLVYTSLIGVDAERCATPVYGDHYWTERAIESRFESWTILRLNHYADSIVMPLLRAARSGSWFSAAGPHARTSYIARQDCALACAHALASTSSDRRTLEVTGNRAIGRTELAEIASALSHRRVRCDFVSSAALREHLLHLGVSAAAAEAMVGFEEVSSRGVNAVVTPWYQMLTGVPPTPLEETLAAYRDAFVQAGQAREPHG